MKRLLALLLAASLLATAASAAGSGQQEESTAQKLYTLGLFKGVGTGEDGQPDFDLDRAPSRVEAVTMLVRALGLGEEAEAMEKSHPFADVPSWADGYVSCAYDRGLTKGVSASSFGSETTATCEMYLTFMLRALGYTEGSGGDFTYDKPYTLARQAGLLPDGVDRENFTRADVAEVTAAALFAQEKGEQTTLADSLIAAGVFTAQAFADAFPAQPDQGEEQEPAQEGAYEQALEDVLNQTAFQVEEQIDTPACTIVTGLFGGVPHAPFAGIALIYKPGSEKGEGVTVELPVVSYNSWGSSQLPDTWELSEDQSTLTYTYRFDEPLVTDGHVYHEAGIYRYTVDLAAGTVEEAFEPISLEDTLAYLEGKGYTVEKTLDAPTCTVVLVHRPVTGVEATDYELYLLWKYQEGGDQPAGSRRELTLPLTDTAASGGATYAWTGRGPDALELSGDGKSLSYSYRFESDLPSSSGGYVHTAGTYRYTADLTTGEVLQVVDPL